MQSIKDKKKTHKKIDPAPSRLSYLLYRFWLRKYIRYFLISLSPVFILSLGFYFLDRETNLSANIIKRINNFSDTFALNKALKIEGINVIADDPLIVKKVINSLDLKFPLNSLSIDVSKLRAKLEKISFVKSATVRITSAGFIEIVIISRNPVVIHRLGTKYVLLDLDGFEVEQVHSRKDRHDLPVLVGAGAQDSVYEALSLLLESKNLVTRIRGLVRVGERRWNVVLDRNQKIYLPDTHVLEAMKKVVSLHEGQKIFDRDIAYVDLRDINRPIIGLRKGSSLEVYNPIDISEEENV